MGKYVSLFIVLLSSFVCVAQNDLSSSAKMIPVVEYNPAHFNLTANRSFNFSDPAYCHYINAIPEALPLTPLQKEVFGSHDSVFIFNPDPILFTELIPQHVRYLGYRDNGTTHFVSPTEDFDSFRDFIVSEFGSTANFTDRYLENLRSVFLSYHSGLYNFQNDDEALQFLRENYRFNCIANRPVDETIDRYIALLKNTVVITPTQENRLKQILRDNYDHKADFTTDFLRGGEFEIFRPECLHTLFSPDECRLIKNAVREDNARLRIAYRQILRTLPNTDSDGRYPTDRDFLRQIADRVFME